MVFILPRSLSVFSAVTLRITRVTAWLTSPLGGQLWGGATTGKSKCRKEYIEITISKSKTDQMGQGAQVCLAPMSRHHINLLSLFSEWLSMLGSLDPSPSAAFIPAFHKESGLLSCECNVMTRVREAGGSLVMIGELEGAFQGAHEVQAGGQLVGPQQAIRLESCLEKAQQHLVCLCLSQRHIRLQCLRTCCLQQASVAMCHGLLRLLTGHCHWVCFIIGLMSGSWLGQT